MLARNRFQYELATGRATLPVTIIICLIMYGITYQEKTDLLSLAIHGAIVYCLIELNTTFSLIRTRTTLHAALFLFFLSGLPFLHTYSHEQWIPLLFTVSFLIYSEAMNRYMLRFLFSLLPLSRYQQFSASAGTLLCAADLFLHDWFEGFYPPHILCRSHRPPRSLLDCIGLSSLCWKHGRDLATFQSTCLLPSNRLRYSLFVTIGFGRYCNLIHSHLQCRMYSA